MTQYDQIIKERREILKAHDYDEIPQDTWWEPHQQRGVPPPPLEKPFPKDAKLIDLVRFEDLTSGDLPLREMIGKRRSRRRFLETPLKLEELSFLLWSTQGIRTIDKGLVWTLRTVPSGGARHPFETYLIVNRVQGLKAGVYRYLPIEHKLLLVKETDSNIQALVTESCMGQDFCGKSAVLFVWAVIPYRSEWRYSIRAYKDMAIEAGHICQNLYLASESIGAGTCAIASYNQKGMDNLIGVDGDDEFIIYVAPVGKVESDAES